MPNVIKAPAIDVEQMFAPDADLTAYEAMDVRDIYLSLMRGVFTHQGLPTDDRTLTPPFVGVYVTAPSGVRTSKEGKLRVGESDAERHIRVETQAVKEAYAGIDWPWGPSASVSLRTMEDDQVVEYIVDAYQESQELLIGAFLNVRDPLNDERVGKSRKLVDWVWAGNADGASEPAFSEDVVRNMRRKNMLRNITPPKKRVLGVGVTLLDRLVDTPA